MSSTGQISTLLFRRVGDSLLATPALRAIKRQLPDTKLRILAEPGVARVFQDNPWIDEVIVVTPSPGWRQTCSALRKSSVPDVAVDFLSDPRSAAACFFSGAAMRIGFEGRGRGWLYTHRVARQDPFRPLYSAIHKLSLTAPLDVFSDDLATDFFLRSTEREWAGEEIQNRSFHDTKLVAFFAHSRRVYKRWPLEHFAHLLQSVKKRNDLIPVLIATPDAAESSARVAELSNLPERHIFRPTDLGRLGAILGQCSALVGNDGGPKHVAVALNVPTVTIFGAEPAEYWTPPNSDRHVALSHWRPGSKLISDEVLQNISPDEVLAALESILK